MASACVSPLDLAEWSTDAPTNTAQNLGFREIAQPDWRHDSITAALPAADSQFNTHHHQRYLAAVTFITHRAARHGTKPHGASSSHLSTLTKLILQILRVLQKKSSWSTTASTIQALLRPSGTAHQREL